MTTPATSPLLQASARGTPAALHLASPETRQFLMRYVSWRVPACDADDVVQATLCDALASGRAPVEERELQRWLLGIARFKVADAHRAAARHCPTDLGDVAAPPMP